MEKRIKSFINQSSYALSLLWIRYIYNFKTKFCVHMFMMSSSWCLQEYMADHDQEYLIEMDSNQASNTLFKVSLHTL